MDGEQSRYKRTPAQCPRHATQQPEQQQSIGDVKQQVGEMMWAGV